MKDILLVLIGGVCSALGGFLAMWYRARIAGRVKLQETIAERKVVAYGEGLEFIGELHRLLLQSTCQEALKFLLDKGSWFADNLILLPHTFEENWRSIRVHLQTIVMKDDVQKKMIDTPGENKRDAMIEEIVKLSEFCRKLVVEAEDSIRKELNLPECEIRNPMKSQKNEAT